MLMNFNECSITHECHSEQFFLIELRALSLQILFLVWKKWFVSIVFSVGTKTPGFQNKGGSRRVLSKRNCVWSQDSRACCCGLLR